jgi:phage-related protein
VAGTARFEAGTADFSARLDARLDRMALPEDYFAGRLDPAVRRLGASVSAAGEQVGALVADLRNNTRNISAALDDLAKQTAVAGASVAQIREAVLERAEALDMAREQIAVFKQFGQTVEKMDSNVHRSLASMGAMEQAVRRIVDETARIADAHRDIGLLAVRQTELTAGVERGFAEWMPKLQETDTRIAGHLKEAIQAFDRSILKVAGAVARQEAALAELSEQLRVLVDRLAGSAQRPGGGAGPRADDGLAAAVRRIGSEN